MAMRPKTDLVVAIAASSEVCKTRAQNYRTRLNSVHRLSETTMAFSLDRSDAFTFLPGQYVNVLVPGTDQRRSYSFSSPPGAETLSFLVRNIPAGVMSTYLRDKAVPGAAVEFIGPGGGFYLREIKRPLLFLAGGTGLAPFLSMLGKICETGSNHPIQLVDGVTNDVDLVNIERLEEFREQDSGLHFRHLCGGCGQRPSAQGLCDGPCRSGPPEWRRGGRLSVRAAPDGGRSPRLARRAERDADEFLLRKVLADRHRRMRPSTVGKHQKLTACHGGCGERYLLRRVC